MFRQTKPRRRLLTLFALILLMTVAPAHAQTRPEAGQPGPRVSGDRAPSARLPQRWIVQLKDSPVALLPIVKDAPRTIQSAGARGQRLNTPEVLRYRTFLAQRQDQTLAAIRQIAPRVQVQRRYAIVFNGMGVVLPGAGEATIERLRRLPNVAAVYPDMAYELDTFSSVPLIGAEALWRAPVIGGQANAGRGVKIAIIDGGIRVDNPFFNPAGFSYPAGFPKGDTAHTTPKVIVARSYFRPDRPPLEGSETPQPGPEDESHGTHVAGIAAGVGGTVASIAGLSQPISGVAPGAYLMNYKVFYANEESNFSAYGIELIAALEDAVADGADVINNSWGGRATGEPFADPITVAVEAAVDAGVTVVFSAGNEGPDPSTAGSPGYSEKVIAVGATTAPRTVASGFVDVVAPDGAPDSLRGQQFQPAAFGPQIEGGTVWGPFPYVSVAAVSGSTLACEPLPTGSLSGQIAVIERGTCPFSTKILNAQIGGANSAIVYNSEQGGDALITMAPGEVADAVGIPSVFVGRSTGLGLLDWRARTGDAARVAIDARGRIVDQPGDVVAAFSSRGPSFQGSLKPDVVAPGFNILSAGYAAGEGVEIHTGFGVVSGTSMAAPHVAGAAALLRQIQPGWSPAQIKSALMSTAVAEVYLDEERTQRATPLEQGAGRINVSAAASAPLLFDRPALSFGNLSAVAGQPTRATLTVQARNVSGQPQQISFAAEPIRADEFTISVSPPRLSIAPGQTASFSVAIEIPAGAPAADYEGSVRLEGTEPSLHLPLWARTLPATPAAKVLLLDNDGSSSLDLPDYSGFYGDALGQLGIAFAYRDLDALAGEAQTLPALGELQGHEILIWFTGDNAAPSGSFPVPTPLTPADQNLLIAYLQSGGNLLVTGQSASLVADFDPNPDPIRGVPDLSSAYLGATLIQDNVFSGTTTLERTVVGLPSQPWLSGITLDLSARGAAGNGATGAGNQSSVNEIAVINTDPRIPLVGVNEIMRAASVGSGLRGVVGINTAAQPTLEQPVPAFRYRTMILSFGLEGVRNDTGRTTRTELLQALLYWMVDRPTVRVEGAATVTAAGQLVSLTAVPETNTPASFVRYRWDFGDGTPIVETDRPVVSHRYARPGTYKPRVEVTDSWGHQAVSTP